MSIDKRALIIGFQYKSSDLIKQKHSFIPGIIIDIYRAYKATLKMGCTRILVITDIETDINIKKLSQVILKSFYIDIGILSIINDLKEINSYYLFNNEDNFKKLVKSFVKESERLFVYYTGHSDNGIMRFPITLQSLVPNNLRFKTTLQMEEFRDMVIKKVTQNCQLVFILDCCHSNGLKLPYYYDKVSNRFILEPRSFINKPTEQLKSSNESKMGLFYTKREVLCFSSSSPIEKSIGTRSGSIFSRVFFGIIFNEINDLFPEIFEKDSKTFANILKIMKNLIKIDQTTVVHSSHPNITSIFRWFMYKRDFSMRVDSINKTLSIRKFNTSDAKISIPKLLRNIPKKSIDNENLDFGSKVPVPESFLDVKKQGRITVFQDHGIEFNNKITFI